ncbi:tryptophanase [Escherichia coli]|uniref:Tryptophanase n=1 Tax=Escherichia coli TaxID=562 RepID=A0A2X1JIJ3_ECOLX|nr:tryptophanase [Escherichia coli]
MENFKHLPEPFRIRVIEPVKRTTRAYREEAIIKSGMNPFLLDSEDVFIDLLTDSGTGAVTQSMQAAMMRGDEAYSGSRSYYALAESVKKYLWLSIHYSNSPGPWCRTNLYSGTD